MKKSKFDRTVDAIKVALGLAAGIGAELIADDILDMFGQTKDRSRFKSILKTLGAGVLMGFVGIKASNTASEMIDNVKNLVEPNIKFDEEDDI